MKDPAAQETSQRCGAWPPYGAAVGQRQDGPKHLFVGRNCHRYALAALSDPGREPTTGLRAGPPGRAIGEDPPQRVNSFAAQASLMSPAARIDPVEALRAE